MKFIRIYERGSGTTFFPNVKEARDHIRQMIKQYGVEFVRQEFAVDLVNISNSKTGILKLLRGGYGDPIKLPGEYFITPRGALKFDKDT